jgi:hypothetical protein
LGFGGGASPNRSSSSSSMNKAEDFGFAASFYNTIYRFIKEITQFIAPYSNKAGQ